MKGKEETGCTRRTRRDYPLGFKLAVVSQIEKGDFTYKQAQRHYGIQGRSTVLVWLRKHGRLDWRYPAIHTRMMKAETPAQKIRRLERELADERLKNQVLEKAVQEIDRQLGTGIFKKVIARTMWFFQQEKGVSLSRLSSLFGCSRQSLYQLRARQHRRALQLVAVREMVQQLRRQLPRVGTRKLHYLLSTQLQQQGIKLGRDGLFDFLRQEHLLICPRHSYTKTTHSKHWLKKHPNLVKELAVERAEQVFVSDITYIKSRQRTHYLSLVTDAFSRRIMGYALSDDLSAESVGKALKMAVKERRTTLPLIHHSDRGLQYCSEHYQRILRKHGIQPSMTDGYDCYQNALAERMNGILKEEFLLYPCNNRQELETLVKQAVESYNTRRPHLSLKMCTPQQVHQKTCELMPTGSLKSS
ncbi:IS3 family transposase [Pontibacter fetidus]|uniref:IS3 family transposase n=1 Tax=Pontibacter fetidus TaxID=2700082 RepID=A0A6B2HCF4_9BACT|nr:IS3 family transposase [Pontibacter fetidus]